MDNLLKSNLIRRFEIIFLDIADRRGLTNVGQFEWINLLLALRHGLMFVWLLLFKRPDIVYICIAQNTLGYLRDCLFLIPSKLLGRKVVVHLHGGGFRNYFDKTSFLMRWLIRWTLCDVRRSIVLGQKLRSIFNGLVAEARIVTVPNGIQLDGKCSIKDRENDHYFKITFLGTLIKSKGFLDVLRAVPLVVAACPSARFVLAGEFYCPREEREAREIVEHYQFHDIVKWPGVVVGEAKTALLESSDIFVFPTYYPLEGQPLVILEAMAAGLPVITTDQAAISETVLDGVNGFIVPSENPGALAEKIILLANDSQLRHRMSLASRDRFLRHYTVERWANDIGYMFHEVLEER